MPNVLRVNGYRFFFFSNEGDPVEPVHIHVRKGSAQAKVWMDPIETESSWGFNPREIREIMSIIEQHHKLLVDKWNEHLNS